jgi:hypothetical protein
MSTAGGAGFCCGEGLSYGLVFGGEVILERMKGRLE